ncbi:MAG: NmrA/HSCARG family protein [Candidatus Caldarchaeum sp.]
MPEKKTIAVIGATGAQGGGLAWAILNDKESEFSVRAITRNPNSDKAKALAAAGAEVVTADLDDVESLKRAFAGAYGVFGVTNFWEHFSPEKELQQAKNIAQAAKDAGVEHVVWSTLEDTRQWVPLNDNRMPTLMEKYKVPHFDAKGEANEIFKSLDVPTTFLFTSFYWDNFIHFGMGPKASDDGKLSFALPMDDKKLPGIAAEDIGKCAYGIFKRGPEMVGKSVGIAGDHVSGYQMAEGMTKSLGKEVQYAAVPPEVYRSFGFPGAEDLGNMFQFKRDFSEMYIASRDLSISKSLNPELQSFEDWISKNASKIPVG